ncbi:MAG: DoxX family membrane protein [Cyclobacteriaceae bacterium]
MESKKIIFNVPRYLAAAILIQTLYFKFTGHPDSMYIFTQMGMEPWGRITMGVIELFAGVLLVIPVLSWLGAGLSLGIMTGAIFSHLGPLGIDVQEDGGFLFALALITFVCSAIVVYQEKNRVLRAFQQVQDKI